ncbi:lysophospholipid acyltransferase family protein [Nocardioides sp. Kera G14]|uniref:lysophospholipid acyltransferase family protein n=1 Tax=Nocardioides sp. Kera G14 TaxID=2884264 RepID=UPI001D115E0C|nr:lysophospholipid acyltransferase family protein [Nocardioides sp. Kera G14]UDY25257.1 1-acyl-sn-glycerol-3-phosphate acyltransferase [Nocardioides sp. Kera G14]
MSGRVAGPPRRYLLDSPLRPSARSLLRHYWDLHVEPGGFPATGPVIVAANHIGVMDGPLMAIMSPRPVHALTKEEMFHGVGGAFLTQTGQIRLDRFHPDRAAVRASLATLEAGRAVGIFPEGTRGAGGLTTFYNGAAYLGLVTGAPIVPLLFFGTRAPGKGSNWVPPRGTRIDMVFGAPLVLDQVNWPRTRENVREATDHVHKHLLAHLAATMAATGLTLPGPLPVPED